MANIYWALTVISALYELTHSISIPYIITIIISILNMREDRKNLSNLPMSMQLESERTGIWTPVVWYLSQAVSTPPSLLLGWFFVRQGLVEGCWWLEALGWKTKLMWDDCLRHIQNPSQKGGSAGGGCLGCPASEKQPEMIHKGGGHGTVAGKPADYIC